MSSIRFSILVVLGLLLVFALMRSGSRYSFYVDTEQQSVYMGDVKKGDLYMWVPAQGEDWVKVADMPRKMDMLK